MRLIAFFFLLLTPWGVPSTFAQDQGQAGVPEPSEFQEKTAVAHVTLDGVNLFKVRGIESYPANRRAREIQGRIIQIAEDSKISPESITKVPTGTEINIMAGDILIMRVFAGDAELEGVDLPTMARVVSTVVGEAVKKYRDDRRPEKIRRAIFLTIGATILFILALAFLHWIFKKLRRILERKEEVVPEKIIKFKSIEFMEADRFWKGVSGLFSAIHILLILIIFFVYLQFVLGLYPWSRFIAKSLVGLVIHPLHTIGQGFIDYIPNLIFLIILTTFLVVLLKFIKAFFVSVERGTFSLRGFEKEWARPTYRILRMLVIIFALIVAYPYIPGSDSAAFKGISIFVGVLFSLGSSSAIANIIAGYSLIYRRAFLTGDRI